MHSRFWSPPFQLTTTAIAFAEGIDRILLRAGLGAARLLDLGQDPARGDTVDLSRRQSVRAPGGAPPSRCVISTRARERRRASRGERGPRRVEPAADAIERPGDGGGEPGREQGQARGAPLGGQPGSAASLSSRGRRARSIDRAPEVARRSERARCSSPSARRSSSHRPAGTVEAAARSSRSSRVSIVPSIARRRRFRAVSSSRSSAARSGRTVCAASVGVCARWSATRSASVTSVSWPTPVTTGTLQFQRASATARSLNAHRSSSEPPPRQRTMGRHRGRRCAGSRPPSRSPPPHPAPRCARSARDRAASAASACAGNPGEPRRRARSRGRSSPASGAAGACVPSTSSRGQSLPPSATRGTAAPRASGGPRGTIIALGAARRRGGRARSPSRLGEVERSALAAAPGRTGSSRRNPRSSRGGRRPARTWRPSPSMRIFPSSSSAVLICRVRSPTDHGREELGLQPREEVVLSLALGARGHGLPRPPRIRKPDPTSLHASTDMRGKIR